MDSARSIPAYGKLYLATSLALSLLVFLKSANPYNLTYTFSDTVFDFSIWRPFTAILYLGRVGILLPLHLLFAAVAFKKIGEKVYPNGKADFVWLFLLSVICLSIFSTFSSMYFFGNAFIMILLMIWAIQYPTDQFFVGRTGVSSIYFPLAYTIVMVVLGSAFKNYMAGFIFGLMLGVAKKPSYVEANGDLFPTPGFIKAFFEDSQVGVQPQVGMAAAVPPARGNGLFSGAGHRIG
jgi:hypothetical protein